ncbi:MAG: DUF1592 domain-containing protein [Myxococcota bacterium]
MMRNGLRALALMLSACTGQFSDGENVGGEEAQVFPPDEVSETVATFTCDEAAAPTELPLRRLSADEYRHTLRDLLGAATDAQLAGDVWSEVSAPLDRLPNEALDAQVEGPSGRSEARFGRLVQAVSQIQVDTQYDIALGVGSALTANDARLEQLLGACAIDADSQNDGACLDGFIDRFATLAFRAPLDPDERSFLRNEAYIDGNRIDAEGVGELIAVILVSPRFLYRFEVGREGPGARLPLKGYELASRLSYHFWGTMPDAELFAAAESGALETDAGYEAQVDRVIADPRAQAVLGTFITEWLGIADLSRLDEGAGDPKFDAFFDTFVPTRTLHEDMVQEVADFTNHVFAQGGTLADLLQSRASFPRSDALAEIYGVTRWEEGDPPVELPEAERAGILTRAGVLAIPSVYPHPILRGVFIRRHLICDNLPEPPGDLAIPDLDPAMSSRAFAEEVTAPDSCQGCHRGINQLGYAFGHYDALGRYISEESVYDDDGMLIDTHGIDASSEPRVDSGDATTVTGAIELNALLAESPKVEACVARQYFRYTHRRRESLASDGCALEGLREAVADGGSLTDLLRAAALDTGFRTRLVEGQ